MACSKTWALKRGELVGDALPLATVELQRLAVTHPERRPSRGVLRAATTPRTQLNILLRNAAPT